MSIAFLNVALLAGLAAVVVPPLVHLLNRRRFDVVPWGAMQFLDLGQRTRRKIFLEELLLMLARMAALGMLAASLAAPVATSAVFRHLQPTVARDRVLVLDGSASMGYVHNGRPLHDAARDWARALLDEVGPDDGVALIHAKATPAALVPEPSRDRDRVRTALHTLPPPRGPADWPAAVQAALAALGKSTRPVREIIVATDGQRYGWADETALLRWELLAPQLRAGAPTIWVVNFGRDRPTNPPNGALLPLRASRAVAAVGQTVQFRGAYQRLGDGELPTPQALALEVDGQPAGAVPLPPSPGAKGQTPFVARHKFRQPGSHRVTVRAPDDALPADNAADFALDVLPALPVLIVDGDPAANPRRRNSDFLRDALTPRRDPTPTVRARVLSVSALTAETLAQEVGPALGPPRVLILHDIARLTPAQSAAVGGFAAAGGGVLVALGPRTDPAAFSNELFRLGAGWLPASVGEPLGDEAGPPVALRTANFFHPALDLFRVAAPGGLNDARFPKRAALTVPPAGPATVAAAFADGKPFLVEKPFGAGRVVACAVPLDNRWKANLIELPSFAPLVHELVYYLAAARGTDLNLPPGQPLRYRPTVAATDWQVQPPDGPPVAVAVEGGQISYADTREPGAYAVRSKAAGVERWYTVAADPRESDLTPADADDQAKVAGFAPTVKLLAAVPEGTADFRVEAHELELWWLGLLGVVGLLAVELWLTRRRALLTA